MTADTSTDRTDAWTIGRLLKWTTEYFSNRQIEQPRLEAEVLLAFARRCERIDLYAAFDEVADTDVRESFRALVRRRAEGTPVPYLVGFREFYSLKFRVTPDVLIPRPETEDLVLAAIDRLQTLRQEPPPEVADIGTGSGNIAIALVKHGGRCRVTAIDISPPALAVALENIESHAVGDRITLQQSDLFDAVDANQKFDLVVSNPPYITSAEMEQLPADIREHEPHLALAAGSQGMDVIIRLIEQAHTRLKPGGWLLVEVSTTIAGRALASASGRGWTSTELLVDSSGQPRVLQAQRAVDAQQAQ